MNYKHKKLWRVTKKAYTEWNYKIEWQSCLIPWILIEDSYDREHIEEKERTRDWLWINDILWQSIVLPFQFKDADSISKFTKKQNARYEIKKRQALNDNFDPDWSDIRLEKFFVYYDTVSKKLSTDFVYNSIAREFHFSSEEKAKQFIKECWQHFLYYYGIK